MSMVFMDSLAVPCARTKDLPAVRTFDFMIRKQDGSPEEFLPVVFFSKDLPGILSCISSEICCFLRERELEHILHGKLESLAGRPIQIWYQSILGNIYMDKNAGSLPCTYNKPCSKHDGFDFFLKGEIYSPVTLSAFQYVTLVLPPLWKKSCDASAANNAPWCMCRNLQCKYTSSRFFHFHFCQDTQSWYVSISDFCRKHQYV